MPELPDIELYLHALNSRIVGQPLERVVVRSPSLLRTFEPAVESAEGRNIASVTRIGKRILWRFLDAGDHAASSEDLYFVFHLMIAGRFHCRGAGAMPKSKGQLAAFQFPGFTLLLTEASQQKRATLHVVMGDAALAPFTRGGVDVRDCSRATFDEGLDRKNRTIKRALTDPTLFDGIGNAYSDEILHAARISPVKWTSRLDDNERQQLFDAARKTLDTWAALLIRQAGDRFPEKVTAFRPEMAVHGRFGQPCPVCGAAIQRIVYAANECNYCAVCQNAGKMLADRSLSRLLKGDWPKTLEEWES
ncbi:MAG: formamidopyrimidine-DNA glycosylase [Planctomycetales bacterium]|nr:formamidopyrimidine-DNA glycosylase [Planctomycetales bacterium]